jgi:hypothetical protein
MSVYQQNAIKSDGPQRVHDTLVSINTLELIGPRTISRSRAEPIGAVVTRAVRYRRSGESAGDDCAINRGAQILLAEGFEQALDRAPSEKLGTEVGIAMGCDEDDRQ